jgi:hypothetical protein
MGKPKDVRGVDYTMLVPYMKMSTNHFVQLSQTLQHYADIMKIS